MSSYTTRVELHSANYNDYENLYVAMQKEGFRRTIMSDTGRKYSLPTAEYDSSHASRSNALDAATRAANSTGKASSILVSAVVGRSWTGLSFA